LNILSISYFVVCNCINILFTYFGIVFDLPNIYFLSLFPAGYKNKLMTCMSRTSLCLGWFWIICLYTNEKSCSFLKACRTTTKMLSVLLESSKSICLYAPHPVKPVLYAKKSKNTSLAISNHANMWLWPNSLGGSGIWSLFSSIKSHFSIIYLINFL
jgi:hypothetical protein